jgi:hypothetical protein
MRLKNMIPSSLQGKYLDNQFIQGMNMELIFDSQ